MALTDKFYKIMTFTRSNGVKETVAISTYAGKTVRGVAKCDPRDEYDEELGRQLAIARCNLKVAKKREIAACKACLKAIDDLKMAKRRYGQMMKYEADSIRKKHEAAKELELTGNAYGG